MRDHPSTTAIIDDISKRPVAQSLRNPRTRSAAKAEKVQSIRKEQAISTLETVLQSIEGRVRACTARVDEP